ncbi:hypothetical protein ACH5RR_029026 [Cinchona calisaya]|uniref:Uncharacterized protein n=1 Tax=Cinchona calisaya TaxID=153742 RepID=A0ABD2YU30_9GENT
MYEGMGSGNNEICSISQPREGEENCMANRMFFMLESISACLDTLTNQTTTRLIAIEDKMDAADSRVNLLKYGLLKISLDIDPGNLELERNESCYDVDTMEHFDNLKPNSLPKTDQIQAMKDFSEQIEKKFTKLQESFILLIYASNQELSNEEKKCFKFKAVKPPFGLTLIGIVIPGSHKLSPTSHCSALAQLVRGVPIVGTKGQRSRVRTWSKALQCEVGLSLCDPGITIPIKEGAVSFWYDNWTGMAPLVNVEEFSTLQAWDGSIWNISSFHPYFDPASLHDLNRILSSGKDELVWKPRVNGEFSFISTVNFIRTPSQDRFFNIFPLKQRTLGITTPRLIKWNPPHDPFRKQKTNGESRNKGSFGWFKLGKRFVAISVTNEIDSKLLVDCLTGHSNPP